MNLKKTISLSSLLLTVVIIYSIANQNPQYDTYNIGYSRACVSSNLCDVRIFEDGKYMFFDHPTDKSGFRYVQNQSFHVWNNLDVPMVVDVYISVNDVDFWLWSRLVGSNSSCVLPRNNPYRLRINGTVHYSGESDVYVTQIWKATVRKNWSPVFVAE